MLNTAYTKKDIAVLVILLTALCAIATLFFASFVALARLGVEEAKIKTLSQIGYEGHQYVATTSPDGTIALSHSAQCQCHAPIQKGNK